MLCGPAGQGLGGPRDQSARGVGLGDVLVLSAAVAMKGRELPFTGAAIRVAEDTLRL